MKMKGAFKNLYITPLPRVGSKQRCFHTTQQMLPVKTVYFLPGIGIFVVTPVIQQLYGGL